MSHAAQTLTGVIPLRVKPRGGQKAMVTPGVLALERRQDITLIKAATENINASYVSRVLRLTLLAPDMVEAILDSGSRWG